MVVAMQKPGNLRKVKTKKNRGTSIDPPVECPLITEIMLTQ